MANVYEIPLGPSQRVMTINVSGVTYTLRFYFCDTPEGGWILDVGDAVNDPIVCGIPLVTGANLLAQYKHLGFTFDLFVVSDADRDAVPTFDNLGITSHLLVRA